MDSQHIVKSYDEQLDKVVSCLLRMGGRAEQQLGDALTILAERDSGAIGTVEDSDRQLDVELLELERGVYHLIALRQPMARDLRVILGAFRGGRDLERIGDHAKNIARHVATLAHSEPLGDEARIMELGREVQRMLAEVIKAYRAHDADLAREVRAADAAVDERYTEVFRDLLNCLGQSSADPTLCTHLILVSRSLERIGDHVTNLAEDIILIAEGEIPEDDRDKRDHSPYIAADQDG